MADRIACKKVEKNMKNGNPLEWTAVLFVVRPRGLEPLSVFGMEPKSIAYTIFATGAYSFMPLFLHGEAPEVERYA